MTDEAKKPLNDKQRAFKRYKEAVARDGKPFFPHGVYHDIIAVIIMMAVIIGLSVVWFAQANCDSWWNVSCKNAATPLEQKQYTPGHPGETKWETKTATVTVKQGDKPPAGATPAAGTRHPLLGSLYEEQADPATTQYHPRPEWYFYFLFYLLILFANPYMVILGTIVVPTVFLINGLSKHNWLEAFLFALAVAVGLTPEMLPMIVTVNLSKGALAMARKKVIVKRLNAISELRGDGRAVHGQDGHSDAGEDRSRKASEREWRSEREGAALRLPEQLPPYRIEEPARRSQSSITRSWKNG